MAVRVCVCVCPNSQGPHTFLLKSFAVKLYTHSGWLTASRLASDTLLWHNISLTSPLDYNQEQPTVHWATDSSSVYQIVFFLKRLWISENLPAICVGRKSRVNTGSSRTMWCWPIHPDLLPLSLFYKVTWPPPLLPLETLFVRGICYLNINICQIGRWPRGQSFFTGGHWCYCVTV